jgi:hypothetical protein
MFEQYKIDECAHFALKRSINQISIKSYLSGKIYKCFITMLQKIKYSCDTMKRDDSKADPIWTLSDSLNLTEPFRHDE